MNFDDLQVIWKEQDTRPLYAIDEAALQRWAREEAQAVTRRVNFEELVMLGSLLVAAGILVTSALLGARPGNYLAALALLAAGGSLLWLRILRQRSDLDFDDSILGAVDRALSQIDHQVRRLRTIGWWLVAPYLVGMGLAMAIEGRSPLVWALVLGVVPLALWDARRLIRRRFEPRRAELTALRDKLTASRR